MQYRLYSLVISLILILVLGYWYTKLVFDPLNSGEISVHFLDVGQGDAILIRTPKNRNVLVDAGRGIAVVNELGNILGFSEKNIYLAVITHFDADHIGGFSPLFDRYYIENILLARGDKDTNIARTVLEKLDKEGSNEIPATVPAVFTIDGVKFYLLSDHRDQTKEENEKSIVLVVKYKDAEVFLSGDAGKLTENLIVDSAGDLLKDIDVLKLGHHGSSTSTSEKLLNVTNPKYAVVSAGKTNRYGHPKPEVVEAVLSRDIELLYTYTGASFCSTGGDFILCD